MFDIGFSELLLVFVIGLIVLGPQRLPVAVKTVVSWIRTLRSLAATVQNEITQELNCRSFRKALKRWKRPAWTT
ncbi:twin-arginine translocation protein TatB [Klebsiella michiganensis]|uniref:Twin-arginine translocation protein TatB n=1 Tax=Klebsiella michiganensis TaxID=1134687 RepID=A0A7H4M2E2_9ENTR|nr:twin-arginine translocation protein TatB [Klebsiella michiganensis]